MSPASNKTLSEQGSDHNWHGGSENAYHLLYDVNYAGVDDKFVSSIMHMYNKVKDWSDAQNKTIFKKWSQQSEFRFGFVPLDNQILPTEKARCDLDMNPIEMDHYVKCTGCPNYMHARVPVKSQLNIEAWHDVLSEYWDQQLLELIEFGFSLDFNRNCPLNHENANHKSATQFPGDVEAYIAEELKFGALLSPFAENPIHQGHLSPFMSRHKPDTDRRRIIVDLSWPLGASVNAGIDKTTYLDSRLDLTFPTIDDITNELKALGKGALLYKVDVSWVFRHVKIDPTDYNLLGLQWDGVYLDMCLPFRMRHGSQIFQHLSDVVH